jgi:K+-sensing histidine kinase KdpD
VRRFAIAVVAPVAMVAALAPLRGHVSPANLALLLALGVLGVAVVAGPVGAAVAGAITAVAFDYVLTVPYGSLAIRNRDDIVTAVLLVIVGVVGGALVEHARRSEQEAAARRAELASMQRRAELWAGGEPPGRLIVRTGDELAHMLGAVSARYERGPAPAAMAVITHWGALVPGGTGAATPDTVAVPVRAHGRDLGHFEVLFARPTAGFMPTVDARHAAVAMADQLGMALLRYVPRY